MRDYSHVGGVGAPELAAGVLVVDEHQNSEYPVTQRAFCPEGHYGRKPWYLVVYELTLGIRCGKHIARGASDIRLQHNHTGIPDQWSKGKNC